MGSQSEKREALIAAVLLLIIFLASLVILYPSEDCSKIPCPAFEKLMLCDVGYNNPNKITVFIENDGIYNEANITEILIDGVSLSSMLGGTSTPRIPFIIEAEPEVERYQIVALTFNSPLTLGTHEVTVHCESGNEYSVNVTIP